MSNTLHDRLSQYIRDLFGSEDAVLDNIQADSAREGLPAISIRAEEGRLLNVLLRAAGARRVVEVGTLAGYSGIWIARALPPEGKLITLERDPRHAEIARRNFERAGLAARVEVREGPALASLEALAAESPFDAIFIDAYKGDYPAYLDWAQEHIRVGGLILAHNALLGGAVVEPGKRPAAEVEALLTFNRRLATDPRLAGIIVPLGDGLSAAVRLG